MSAIDQLLGPNPFDSPARSHGEPLVRTLLGPGDVLIHLQEDVTDEEVVLFSFPGRLENAQWMVARTTPWKRIRRNPLCQDGSSVLTVRPETHEVILIEVWPRCALDSVALGNTLMRHLRRHTRWRKVLAGPSSRSDVQIVGAPTWIPDLVRDDRVLSLRA